jgi:tetratricopeptide (TPR) repeat protein
MRRQLTVIAILTAFAAAPAAAQIYNPGAGGPPPARPGQSSSGSVPSRGPARSAYQYYERGKAYADRRDWERALGELQRAVEIEDDHVESLLLLGFIYREMNDRDRALQFYQRAIRYRPGHAEAHYMIGRLALDRDDVTLAVRQYLILRDSGSDRADEMWAQIERYVRTHS